MIWDTLLKRLLKTINDNKLRFVLVFLLRVHSCSPARVSFNYLAGINMAKITD